jgi:hypothetical protein
MNKAAPANNGDESHSDELEMDERPLGNSAPQQQLPDAKDSKAPNGGSL